MPCGIFILGRACLSDGLGATARARWFIVAFRGMRSPDGCQPIGQAHFTKFPNPKKPSETLSMCLVRFFSMVRTKQACLIGPGTYRGDLIRRNTQPRKKRFMAFGMAFLKHAVPFHHIVIRPLGTLMSIHPCSFGVPFSPSLFSLLAFSLIATTLASLTCEPMIGSTEL